MARYFGLKGDKLLSFMLYVIIVPTYVWFGYNNAAAGATKSHNATIQGTVVALYTAGCAVGSLSCILIGDKLGRLKTGFIGIAVTMVGTVLQCTSFSLAQLIVGRVVAGLGFGAVTATIPVWQAECSKSRHRGSFVVLEGVFISIGLFVSQWINLGFYFVHSSASWRFPLAFPMVFGIIVLSFILNCPESPRWLVKMGRYEEAADVLSVLNDLPADDEVISQEIAGFKASLEEIGKGSLKGIFQNGPNRIFYRTLLAAGVQIWQQMSGINCIGFFAGTLFEEYIGLTPIVSRVLSGCTFTFQACCAMIAYYTVDRLGRRKLMLTSALGMGCSMIALAVSVSQVEKKSAAIAASVFVFVFTGFFPIGYLGLPFLYATEVAPLAYRVPINAISTGTTWCFNFMIAEVTPTAFANIHYKYYIIFAVTNLALITPCVYFFYPETNGRSLEEMDLVFINSKRIIDIVSTSLKIEQDSLVAVKGHVSADSIEKEKAASLEESAG